VNTAAIVSPSSPVSIDPPQALGDEWYTFGAGPSEGKIGST
jgi:hypothetical protein